MNTVTLTHMQYGETFHLVPDFGHYSNGRLAVSLVDINEGPFCHITINIPEAELADDEVIIKNWSENEAIYYTLREAGWLRWAGRKVRSGFIEAPVMVLDGPLLDAYNATKGV